MTATTILWPTILANPAILKQYFEEDTMKDQILCVLRDVKEGTMYSVKQPRHVIMGWSAWRHLNEQMQVAKTSLPPNPREALARKFEVLTQTKIELFTSISPTDFPATHPFQSNGALQLLMDYANQPEPMKIPAEVRSLPRHWLEERFGFSEEVMDIQTTIVLLGEKDDDYPIFGGLQIERSEFATIEQHLLAKPSFDRVAHDFKGNLWVSAKCLFSMLTGKFYLPAYYTEMEALQLVSPTIVLDQTLAKFDLEDNQAKLNILRHLNYQVTILPLKEPDGWITYMQKTCY